MKIHLKACLMATGLGIFAVPVSAHAEAESGPAIAPGDFRLSTGVSFSSGDYGDIEDTDVFAIPVSLTYRSGGLKVRVSVPWVKIDGPGSLISTPEGRDGGGGDDFGSGRGGDSDNSGSGSSNSGSGSGSSGSGSSGSGSSGSGSSGSGNSGSGNSGSGSSGSGSGGSGSSGSGIEVEDEDEGEVIDDGGSVPGGGATLADNKRSGIGDVAVSAVYSFELGGGFYFEPGVKLKLPTASRRKRLGTGEFDVTVSSDLVKEFGAASVYVHARRKFAGKPAGSTIRSTWGAGGGASLRLARGFTIGADYDWQQSAFTGRKASSELTGWTYARLNRNLGLTLYASTGFNANSADFAGGASISYRF